MGKPLFNTAFGAFEASQQARPPVRFNGVTANVFPLRANMARLRAFCSDYLNIASDIVHFRPAMPWVYLMVLDYGRMAARAQNFGWVAQHEIAFAVPLEWYVRQDDRWQFVDWASVCPYIFVDNEMSLSTGREVFGWPKIQVTLEPDATAWVSDPMAPQSLLTASAPLFPELYAGRRPEPEVFLRIRQQAPPWRTRFPPDPDRFDPLATMSRAISGFWGGIGRMFDMARALPVRGYPRDAVPTAWLNMLSGGAKYMTAFGAQPPRLNNITLKQFRDAELPTLACYQGITNSVMKVRRFNGGGMLGDVGLFFGDPSGGIDITLRRSASLPIVDALGLEMRHEEAAEADMVSVRPTLPFWQNVDLEYGTGETICWRTKRSFWVSNPATVDAPEPPGGASVPENRFNTARGVGAQDVVGPFQFPNTTIRVLPLLADESKLAALCVAHASQLGPDCPFRVEPWGSYVYLVISSFGEMSSPNDIGWWAQREVKFYIAVRLIDDASNVPVSAGLMPVFAFADPQMAAVVEREVNGRPTLGAAITASPGAWLSDSGPAGENATLMTLDTLMLPALYLGHQAEWRRLLEVTEVDAIAYNADVAWSGIAAHWVGPLQSEVRRKAQSAAAAQEAFADVRDLAVRILAGQLPLSVIALKQFRDVAEPDAACYQALVRCARVIQRVHDLREIESRLHVRIRRNPAIDIAGLLGLQVKHSETTADGVVDVVQPIRPFWARLSMHEELGETLCWRTGETWQGDGTAADDFLLASKTPPAWGTPTPTGRHFSGVPFLRLRPSQYLDGAPQDIDVASTDLHGPDLAKLRGSFAAVEPQLVIESMLSKEWCNWGNPRFFRRLAGSPASQAPAIAPDATPPSPTRPAWQKPIFCIPCYSIGSPGVRRNRFGDGATISAWWYVEPESEDLWFPPA